MKWSDSRSVCPFTLEIIAKIRDKLNRGIPHLWIILSLILQFQDSGEDGITTNVNKYIGIRSAKDPHFSSWWNSQRIWNAGREREQPSGGLTFGLIFYTFPKFPRLLFAVPFVFIFCIYTITPIVRWTLSRQLVYFYLEKKGNSACLFTFSWLVRIWDILTTFPGNPAGKGRWRGRMDG